jgi:hypothetical protein
VTISGAFTAITAAGFVSSSGRPLLVPLGVAALVDLLTRRTLTSLVAGWALLAAMHVAQLV